MHETVATCYNAAEGVPPEPYAPPIGCPCTTQLLCEHEHRQGYPFNSFLRAQQALGPNRADPPLWLFDDNCTQFSFKVRETEPYGLI